MGKEQEKKCFSCGSNFPAAYSSCPRCQLPLVFPAIGRVWQVDRLIGRGGMGAVFLCHHVEDAQRLSAVKVLQLAVGEQRADRQEKLARFQREAEALGRLEHPAIVELYDFARDKDGSLYMAMEYLQGIPLSRVLTERGPCEPAEAVALAVKVLAALFAAHRVGIVHRDIKPDNIVVLVDPETGELGLRLDRIKVVDFGVARLKNEALSEEGHALGTPVYMAPEQAQGSEVDERADVYSVAAVLYELLAGRPPFLPPDGPNSKLLLLAKIMTTDPLPLRELRPEVSPALESVIDRALCRDRSLRFATASDFSQALLQSAAQPQERLWHRPPNLAPLLLPSLIAQAVSPSRPTPLTRTLPPAVRSSASIPPVLRSTPIGISRSSLSSSAIGRAALSSTALAQSHPSTVRAESAPVMPMAASPSGPQHNLVSGPYPLPSSVSSSASLRGTLPPVRSGDTPSPSPSPMFPSVESSRSHKFKVPASHAHRVLVAFLYLAAVAILLGALLFDRSSCRPGSDPGGSGGIFGRE